MMYLLNFEAGALNVDTIGLIGRLAFHYFVKFIFKVKVDVDVDCIVFLGFDAMPMKYVGLCVRSTPHV